MKMLAIILGCLVILYTAYLVLLFILGMTKTEGIAYYGKPLSERRKFKDKVM